MPLSILILHIFQSAVIGIDDEDDSTFTITVDQKTFHFQGKKKYLSNIPILPLSVCR